MSEILIIKIIFNVLLSLGSLVLFFLSFKLFYKYLIQEKKCTSVTKGTVRKYTLISYGGENSSINLPVVFYNVNGNEYKVIGPEYKKYKSATKKKPLNSHDTKCKEENQIFTINTTANSFINIYKNPMESLYPIGSNIDVYYDPKNPKLSYVLRYCNKKYYFYLTFFIAVFTLTIDVLILFML